MERRQHCLGGKGGERVFTPQFAQVFDFLVHLLSTACFSFRRFRCFSARVSVGRFALKPRMGSKTTARG